MLSEVAKQYQAKTGQSAWESWGNDPETDCHLEVYIEGPTVKYVNWLEDRASKSSKVDNSSASTNKQSDQICSDCKQAEYCHLKVSDAVKGCILVFK